MTWKLKEKGSNHGIRIRFLASETFFTIAACLGRNERKRRENPRASCQRRFKINSVRHRGLLQDEMD